ncbi:hypothetical protein Taro_019129 [Colocasia esculenta]|uniref:Cytochrome c-553 n=1 Tax=Colocasia esculenta TaxID=4460 RepID=A0A843UKC3_COLES|nr:hypothetical protein [Colocasia esculenta]
MLPPPVTSACSVGGAPTASSLPMLKVCCATRGEENPCVRRRRRQEQREVRPRRLGWLAPPSLVAAAVLALSHPYLVATPVSLGQTVDVTQKGAALFQKACIGCHDAGGNILQPGATLFMRDLER